MPSCCFRVTGSLLGWRTSRIKSYLAMVALAGAFLTSAGGMSLATAATVPFAEDFSGAAPDFTYSSSSVNLAGVVGGGVLTIDSAPGTGGQSINALVNISNATGQGVVMETDIKPTAWIATGGSSAGFLAFSTNPASGAFPSGPNSGFLADIVFPQAGNGLIRILDASNGLATVIDSSSTPFAVGSLALNETYHLALSVTPAGVGFVNLSLTITDTAGVLIDEDGIVTISSPAPVAASTGTFFGYRHRVGNNGGTAGTRTFDAVYDNLTIVPEPSAFILIGIGVLGMVHVYRRSQVRA